MQSICPRFLSLASMLFLWNVVIVGVPASPAPAPDNDDNTDADTPDAVEFPPAATFPLIECFAFPFVPVPGFAFFISFLEFLRRLEQAA